MSGSPLWQTRKTLHPRRLPHLPQHHCQGIEGCRQKNDHDSALKRSTNIIVYMDYNDTIQACRDMVKEWDRRDASRRKALSQLQTKSPLPHASRFGGLVILFQKKFSSEQKAYYSKLVVICFFPSEQKAYLEKVKEERLVKEELMSQDEEEEIPVTEREMNLKVIFVDYDQDDVTSYSDGYLLENDESESSRLIMSSIAGSHIQLGLRHVQRGTGKGEQGMKHCQRHNGPEG